MTRQGARRIELAEASGAISVRKLREAAEALECDLAVVLVPRGGLEEIVARRAEALATVEVVRIDHSMALEDQQVGDDARAAMIQARAQEMIDDNDPRIWRP